MAHTQDETDQSLEERLRDEGRQAFHRGEYDVAFSRLVASIVNTALRWFREEGVAFTKRKPDLTSTELLIGLAWAAEAELRERGDAASDRVTTATYLLQTVAEIRVALDQDVPLEQGPVEHKIAELMLRGFMLGQLDNIANSIQLGWLEKLAEHALAKQARQAGAAKVNARKASAKERALGEAMRIANRNPTLSNEELARKMIEAAEIATTIRTGTDWVREWRRQGHIPPPAKTVR